MDARVSSARLRDLEIRARHLANFGPLCLIGLVAFVLAFHRVSDGTLLIGRLFYGLVVALNAVTLAMSSWSAVLGTAVRFAARIGFTQSRPVVASPTGRARTAVLIAIHEEDAARVFAAARTIADDFVDTCVGTVDLFVLSDSRSAAAIEAEAAMLARSARSTGARLFYRRRAENSGRKAGNVADFVRRWGGAYDFMVLLDADSLMTGACIGRLIGAMEANPQAGLIQAMAYPVGRTSVFARLQQFNSRLIGPVFQAGVAFWQGPRGNFWGHNAIIRIAPFAASCGLPVLPGRPPLGGDILSHDTVEAALLLRRGYDIWMLPHGRDGSPDESWEETPTNLLDHLERDRRWLRGNLQHVRVLAASGLKAASYYHLIRGLSHFLYAPLLVSWLGLYALLDRSSEPDALAILFVVLLIMPRVLGLISALGDPEQVAAVGGRGRLGANVLLDQLIFALLYPVVLVSHLVGLAGLLTGGETRWDPQSRDERGLSWRDTARRLGPQLVIASIGILLLAVVAPLPAAMFVPGLLLGIPVTVATSRRVSTRLFEIPEDVNPHPLRAVRAAIEGRLRAGEPSEHSAPVDALPRESPLAMPTQALRRSDDGADCRRIP